MVFLAKRASKTQMRKLSYAGSLAISLFVSISAISAVGQTPTPVPPSTVSVKGKTPVIIIPGFTGSELVNSKTGEEVWFKPRRSHDDDLQLPISPNLARNRDNLVTRDIIRSVKLFKFLPETEIYERLINTLETRGGYKEGSFKNPPPMVFRTLFMFFPTTGVRTMSKMPGFLSASSITSAVRLESLI